ncbi:MAG: hypothetical protein KKF50_05455 [Nanoarchaeota archaeon]|nr:hypothetical protein [Nanoarchaeota archaeon]
MAKKAMKKEAKKKAPKKKTPMKKEAKKNDEKMTKPQARKVLGVSNSAHWAEIEAAYHEKVTDAQMRIRRGNPRKEREQAQDELVKILTARILLNPELREQAPETFVDTTPPEESTKSLKAPEPQYALQKDLCKVTESQMILSRDLVSMNRIYREGFDLIKENLREIEELSLKRPTLIRKVTIKSPNSTITTEETFSSEK